MKFLSILGTLLFTASAYAWQPYPDKNLDFIYEYNEQECGWGNERGAVIFLGGMSSIPDLDSGAPALESAEGIEEAQTLFRDLLQDCYLLIVPTTPTHKVGDRIFQMWDMTDTGSQGVDTTRVAQIVLLSSTFYDRTFLGGVSNGAVTTYKVANYLKSTAHSDALTGIYILDGTTPYTMSDNDDRPPSMEGLDAEIIHRLFGFSYWLPVHNTYDYVSLGFPHRNVVWDLPTLIVNSTNDTTVADHIKLDFSDKLSKYATDLTIEYEGYKHNVGTDGYNLVYDWITTIPTPKEDKI
jgi:hypothetical protein